jgi:hypothetical protein
MAHGRPRDPRKEQQWRRWIHEWQTSGLTVRDFCTRRGLAEARFYTWRRQLRRREDDLLTLVPVQVLTAPESVQGTALELVVRGGRTVRVPPGFDAPTLRHLLAVLEEQPPC